MHSDKLYSVGPYSLWCSLRQLLFPAGDQTHMLFAQGLELSCVSGGFGMAATSFSWSNKKEIEIEMSLLGERMSSTWDVGDMQKQEGVVTLRKSSKLNASLRWPCYLFFIKYQTLLTSRIYNPTLQNLIESSLCYTHLCVHCPSPLFQLSQILYVGTKSTFSSDQKGLPACFCLVAFQVRSRLWPRLSLGSRSSVCVFLAVLGENASI